MGTSKSYRGGPSWQGRNTPGKATKPSKGSMSTAEGTQMSGNDDYGRTGMKNTARKKSKAGRTSAKNMGPHGYS